MYSSLLQPIIDYASVIWKQHYFHHITRLESKQKRFVKLVGAIMGCRYADVSDDNLMKQAGSIFTGGMT